jgi:hypothetical protein
MAINGFWAGLEPPTAGCEWHEKHWFELKRGPCCCRRSHGVDILEPGETILEERCFVRGQAGQGTAGARRAGANSGVYGVR